MCDICERRDPECECPMKYGLVNIMGDLKYIACNHCINSYLQDEW